MSELFETIKQGAGQVLSGIDQKGQLKSAFDGIRQQLTEMEHRRQVNALGNDIKNLQSEMKQMTEALGLQTMSLYDAGKIVHPELMRLCERINELQTQIQEKKARVTELGEQAQAQATAQTQSQCPQCQAAIAADAEFCPKCGAQLQQPAPKPAPSNALPTSSATRTVVRLRCPRCKTMLAPEAEFCPTCGVKLKRPQTQPAPLPFCSSCGAELKPGAQFCPICGQAVQP